MYKSLVVLRLEVSYPSPSLISVLKHLDFSFSKPQSTAVHLSWSLLSILSILHYFNTWTLGLQKPIVAMKSTIILSSIFAAFAAASPVNLDARDVSYNPLRPHNVY
jgi:hypothetical protein